MSTFSVFWGEMFPGESHRRPYISHTISRCRLQRSSFVRCVTLHMPTWRRFLVRLSVRPSVRQTSTTDRPRLRRENWAVQILQRHLSYLRVTWSAHLRPASKWINQREGIHCQTTTTSKCVYEADMAAEVIITTRSEFARQPNWFYLHIFFLVNSQFSAASLDL